MLWHAFIRRERLTTLYASDRFPRATWDAFRTRCAADGENWIDVLRRLLDQHAARKAGDTTTTD